MKAGWKVKPLEDAAQIVNGGTPKSGVADYWGGEVQWLTPKDMGQMEGREIANTPRAITERGLRDSSARLVPPHSVILSTRAPIGHLAINTAPMAFNQGCRGIVPRDGLDHLFLYYFLLANRELLDSLGTGTTFKELSGGSLKAVPIPLPPLEEQQQIVAVLDEAFEGLARARAHAEANLRDARELFETSLRVVFGEASTGWPMRTLPDVCADFGRGKSRHRPRNEASLYGGDIPFVQTGDLSSADHFITEFSQTYSERGLAQSKLWPAGTVCIAIVGATIGESGILDFDACFPDSVIGMTADQTKADPEYIEYLLQSFKAELKEAGKGSARDNINLATFEDRLFPMPDVPTQKAVANRLNSLSAEAKLLSRRYAGKLDNLDALRQSLFQKAFVGELT